jgi:hypothetical protein
MRVSASSLIDMTFKTLSKRQNGTVDPSLSSLHLIEGRVIPDWKQFISSGENIIRFLGSVPVDVQDLPYWFCALCHRRETIMLESDQLEKTEPFQQ